MLTDGISGLESTTHDLCVVGAGPVGLALATECSRLGLRVLVLESGGKVAEANVQSLSDADVVDPSIHDDMEIAVARRLGGTSNLWGGRCLPYDPIDFEPREWVDARWPIRFPDIEPYVAGAVRLTRSGAPVYREPVPGLRLPDATFVCDALERWASKQQAQAVHAMAIRRDPKLDVRTHATLVGINFAENGTVASIDLVDSGRGERVRANVCTLVIAAGGLESARILLAARRSSPQRFGGEHGFLGRTYMGHLTGEIADVVFSSNGIEHAFGFRVDAHGSYVRRRMAPTADTQSRHRLLNIAFWPTVPSIADPKHGSAVLSLVYLAMSYGFLGRMVVAEAIRRKHVPVGSMRRWPHYANVFTGLPSALEFGFALVLRRLLQQARLPGLFVHNRANRYGLYYHAEQAPRRDSRVTLSRNTDMLGVPMLSIDYRRSEQDADSVIRAHELLESWLSSGNLGRLEYRVPRNQRMAAVLAQVHDGTHQIGVTRMGTRRDLAVVDENLRSFDSPNLYVVSAGVLPTSGQANPTLTAVALALRLARHLANERGIQQ